MAARDNGIRERTHDGPLPGPTAATKQQLRMLVQQKMHHFVDFIVRQKMTRSKAGKTLPRTPR
jgi:hypothetical protein